MQTGTPIEAPFQGAQIGAFRAVAPGKDRYLRCIVESERTPEAVSAYEPVQPPPGGLAGMLSAMTAYASAKWGEERFSPEETSVENEMSVVQFAQVAGSRILLTGDAGRAGLGEAADHLAHIGVGLPGINVFQVPHHGSRRNVSTEILDRLLGQRLWFPVVDSRFSAVISAAKDDSQHPRRTVVRLATTAEAAKTRCQRRRAPFAFPRTRRIISIVAGRLHSRWPIRNLRKHRLRLGIVVQARLVARLQARNRLRATWV